MDSSVIVKWVNSVKELLLDKADLLMEKAQDGKVELIASELAKYEVGNALFKKGMSLPQTLSSMSVLYSLPIRFVVEDERLSQSSLEIAYECRMTYYDAAPIALALRENAGVVTDNFRHQAKANKVRVIALEDYS